MCLASRLGLDVEETTKEFRTHIIHVHHYTFTHRAIILLLQHIVICVVYTLLTEETTKDCVYRLTGCSLAAIIVTPNSYSAVKILHYNIPGNYFNALMMMFGTG